MEKGVSVVVDQLSTPAAVTTSVVPLAPPVPAVDSAWVVAPALAEPVDTGGRYDGRDRSIELQASAGVMIKATGASPSLSQNHARPFGQPASTRS